MSDLSDLQTDVAAAPPDVATTLRRQRPRMALTRNLKRPTEYVRLMNVDFAKWAFNEERAPLLRGRWRTEALEIAPDAPMDLEIGTGNGMHFADRVKKDRDRAIVGIELKFKPLIQSIRRALRFGSKACILRYDACRLDDIFALGEIDNVYIHFPDPWSKQKKWKHRLIQDDFLEVLHALMRAGGYVDFKTDSREYFEWAVERFARSRFVMVRESWDLHRSEWRDENFVTQFEAIFSAQGLPIHYARLVKQ